MSDINQLLNEIKTNDIFLRLKNVVENTDGWHDHETALDHTFKVVEVARRRLEGDFITNSKAKKLFLNWLNEDLFGIKRKDVLITVAYLHDCGKILRYREEGVENVLITPRPQHKDQTLCPGHEYWGAKLVVREIIKNAKLNDKLEEYIVNFVRLHGTFNGYFIGKENWSKEELLEDIRSQAEGYYKETMFNSYCDGYTADAFTYSKVKIEEMFNDPRLYIERTYFI